MDILTYIGDGVPRMTIWPIGKLAYYLLSWALLIIGCSFPYGNEIEDRRNDVITLMC